MVIRSCGSEPRCIGLATMRMCHNRRLGRRSKLGGGASCKFDSRLAFSSRSFIRLLRSPNNITVGGSGTSVRPLYWEGRAALNPSLCSCSICKLALASKLNELRHSLRASVGSGSLASSVGHHVLKPHCSGDRIASKYSFICPYNTFS